ncbi:MAG: hypothetical protein WB679_19115 [Terracidiphilus sp.]
MAGSGKALLVAATLIGAATMLPMARAATAPSDPCSLLTAADVSKSMGQTYGAPEKTVAPRPYANTVQGTDCHYSASSGGNELLFRIYFDPSAADATGLFAKLKFFYSPPTPVPGLGDEAYFDPNHGLHVRKGNVRFFLNLADNTDSQLKAIASLIAGRI